jgi:hypothetical protein
MLFTRKLMNVEKGSGRSSGLLAGRYLPIPSWGQWCRDRTVWLNFSPTTKELTATGIAPEFHRTSLLITGLRPVNQNHNKNSRELFFSKRSFTQFLKNEALIL